MKEKIDIKAKTIKMDTGKGNTIKVTMSYGEQSTEYSGLGVRAVRWLGNRLAIIQNTRNLTNIKPANAPQSGSGLDIGSISYEW